jgi:hypothetical protein
VTPFQWSGEARHPQWTSIARKLLDRAPDRISVLKLFIGKFRPTAWTGSRAAIVESNVRLLDELAADYPNPAFLDFIGKEKARLAQAIQAERQTETLIERKMDERFE